MKERVYSISQVDEHIFEFVSNGKRPLLKRVILTETEHNSNIYNMALGTVLKSGVVDYTDESNNGDIVELLSTVVCCVKIFTENFPGKTVFFKGNTTQKIRVYYEILRRNIDQFSIDFNIFGMDIIDGHTVVTGFDADKKYSGFFVKRKLSNR
jgi:uncharacterized protein DUF6934